MPVVNKSRIRKYTTQWHGNDRQEIRPIVHEQCENRRWKSHNNVGTELAYSLALIHFLAPDLDVWLSVDDYVDLKSQPAEYMGSSGLCTQISVILVSTLLDLSCGKIHTQKQTRPNAIARFILELQQGTVVQSTNITDSNSVIRSTRRKKTSAIIRVR